MHLATMLSLEELVAVGDWLVSTNLRDRGKRILRQSVAAHERYASWNAA